MIDDFYDNDDVHVHCIVILIQFRFAQYQTVLPNMEC